jgi:hypothetical protein
MPGRPSGWRRRGQLREPAAKPLVAGSAGRHHRHQGLGAPQLVDLGDERLGDRRGKPDRVVVGGHELGRGVRQDEGAGAFRFGRREEDPGWPGVDLGQQRGPLGADLVQDRGQLLGI